MSSKRENFASYEWLQALAERVAPLKNLHRLHLFSEDDSRPECGWRLKAEDRSIPGNNDYRKEIKLASFITPQYGEPLRAAIQNTPGLIEDLTTLYQEYDLLLTEYNVLRALLVSAAKGDGLEEPKFSPLKLRMRKDDP